MFAWALLPLLFTACSEDEEVTAPRTYPVRMYVGLPAVYGYANLVGYNQLAHPVSEATIKIYRTKEDYVADRNVLLEEKTDEQGELTFERDSTYALWFRVYKDTLSNDRGVSSNPASIAHNEIVFKGTGRSYNNYDVFATLTNTPTKLRLLVYHEGQPVEGAQVQLYFTEQAYQDSLAAQEDFEQLRPTYGYYVDDPSVSDEKEYLIWINEDNFLQTTNKAGEVYFDNLEPRNYWFQITKDTLSNEGMIMRTREALPREAEITTQMEVSIQ